MGRPVCRACGAAMSEESVWCPRCFRRPVTDEAAAALVAEVDRLSQPERWEPPRRFHERRTTRSMWSRRFAGPTSFGLRGRIAMTAILAGLFVLGALQLGVSTNGGPCTIIYVGFTLPGSLLLIREFWKKERNVVPLPKRECRVCRESIYGEAGFCPRCKAAV